MKFQCDEWVLFGECVCEGEGYNQKIEFCPIVKNGSQKYANPNLLPFVKEQKREISFLKTNNGFEVVCLFVCCLISGLKSKRVWTFFHKLMENIVQVIGFGVLDTSFVNFAHIQFVQILVEEPPLGNIVQHFS
jgi:hypothetical protein